MFVCECAKNERDCENRAHLCEQCQAKTYTQGGVIKNRGLGRLEQPQAKIETGSYQGSGEQFVSYILAKEKLRGNKCGEDDADALGLWSTGK